MHTCDEDDDDDGDYVCESRVCVCLHVMNLLLIRLTRRVVSSVIDSIHLIDWCVGFRRRNICFISRTILRACSS